MKKIFFQVPFVTVLVVGSILGIKQVQAQTMEQLQAQLEECKKEAQKNQVRAEAAEKEAMMQKKLAVTSQKMAEENAEKARRAERGANRLRYLAQAKVMALKSKELGDDPMQEALLALQAYKFHSTYEGNPTDIDISGALQVALKKFNDPGTQADLPGMAASICKHVNRNMTREEWDTFAGSDLSYERTCENLPANNK